MSALPSRACYSVPEVCVLTGLGRDTIYRAIRNGKLIGRKTGIRRTVVMYDDLKRFLRSLPQVAPKAACPPSPSSDMPTEPAGAGHISSPKRLFTAALRFASKEPPISSGPWAAID
jgi:excisionase family DNA binding protein